MTAGEGIKKVREEENLTQEELGKLCGISTKEIYQYELGLKKLNFGTLEKISIVLDVPIVYLIDNGLYEINLIKLFGIRLYEILKNLSKKKKISIPRILKILSINGLNYLELINGLCQQQFILWKIRALII